MRNSRFDLWTRRRFGLATGGLAASLLAVAASGDAEARKKRRKRCKKAGKTCGGKRKCCRRFRCAPAGETETSLVKRCCKDAMGASCRSSADCCRPMGCNLMTGLCDVP
jgi:hypothetical protein